MNKIIVFGLGAVGSNLIAKLAKEIPNVEFYGIDADFISKRELPLLPWNDKMYNNWRKVKAVNYWLYNETKRQCQTTDKYITKVTDIKHIVDNFTDPEDKYLVVECFDNLESRELFKNLEYPILHCVMMPDRRLICKWNNDFDYEEYKEDQGELLHEPEAAILVNKIVQVAIDIVIRYFTEVSDLPQINIET
jgi:hypothetical protein